LKGDAYQIARARNVGMMDVAVVAGIVQKVITVIMEFVSKAYRRTVQNRK
jgi:hypothetical protein